MDQLVSDFNTYLKDLINQVADICPNSVIGRNITDVNKYISKPEHRDKFIVWFILKILQYKDEIDQGNEDFFLKKIKNKDYKDELEGNESMTDQIFEFGSIWNTLKRENKDVIIQYMQILCELAQAYFIEYDKKNTKN